MLQHLAVKNIVLIEACDIAFEEGLCVLTGETGAGKSILLDALGLALGDRADAKLLRAGESVGSVTAEFDITRLPETKAVLRGLELDGDDDALIIRRSLSADGKTRCYINDQPVSVAALRQVGETLIEIHGQHDQRGLLDVRSHVDLLDAYGRLDAQRDSVAAAWVQWREFESALSQLREQLAQSRRDEEYLRHMMAELEELNPQIGEEEALAERRTLMMQGEKLAGVIAEVSELLTQGDSAVDGQLQAAQRVITRQSGALSGHFAEIAELLERALIEVQEAATRLERMARESAYSPADLEVLEERLFAIKAAARKYQVSADSLPQLLTEVEAKLGALDHQQGAEAELTQRVRAAREQFAAKAKMLSEARQAAALRLEKAMAKELAPLKMQGTKFRVALAELPEEQWNSSGMDRVAFEACTNVGGEFAPLSKIASGGELSRFMLALKVALAHVRAAGTLIFDEIDTGTGGAVADAIGARLALLSDHVQVLVVTHLPQVAARGHHHLRISKTVRGGATQTKVETLSVAARKEELARMLAGASVTDEARFAAESLLQAAR